MTTFEPAGWNNYLWVLRAVVVDGATPVEGTEGLLGIGDPAIFAANTSARAFLRSESLEQCALFANAFLDSVVQAKAPQLSRRQRPQAVVRAVDIAIGTDGAVHHMRVLNAGDSTSHIYIDGEWTDSILDNGFKTSALARWHKWLSAHPGASLRQTQAMEDVFFATRDDFDSTPIGAFADAKTTSAHIDGSLIGTLDNLGLVLATDGIRAPEHVSAGLYLDHLVSGKHRTSPQGHVKATDDVAVLAIGNRAPSLHIASVRQAPISA